MPEFVNYAHIPDGKCLAVLVSVIDMGEQKKTWNNETKVKPVVRLEFEAPDHKKDEQYNATVKAELNLFAYEKANIAPYFKALGITITGKETQDEMLNLLGDKLDTTVELEVESKTIDIMEKDGTEKQVKYNIIK